MSRNAGFTLTELVIVVALIGIVAAVTVPAMNNALERNRVYTSVELIAAQIREARLTAITHNARFRIRFDCFGGRAIRTVAVTGDPSIDLDPDRCSMNQPNDGEPWYPPRNVTIFNMSPGLEIDGRGFITPLMGSMPQAVGVAYGSFSRSVVITGTGRVRTPIS